MKKIVALLLALVMVFALCACGGDQDRGARQPKAERAKRSSWTSPPTKAEEAAAEDAARS